ncbi:GNAT family N-acetyltransferase [Tritonibacter mobilis]|uniref:GNAT family N-acetyltransferase n=1 Tax=Tritonibacter mobilis TaxID=379347 RepID=UPI0014032832|nr:GNAT family N-acetyltransferase [Tritonibacter mobilis]NHM17554.1 GNAT family N-acetyltransferase [Tritonibacter mobilis]NHM21742.1 GNAT family N-acetyltransferase [Tritonibacter mobilis]
MNDKENYRALCESDESVPLFHQAWWLDAVCGKNGWNVVTYIRGGRIVAALPYVIKKKFGFSQIGQPNFTQTLGVWFAPTNTKYTKKIGQEKEIIFSLIDSLPKHHVFFQSFHHSFVNWMPFYFRGFEQTTKYSYVIEDLSDTDRVWKDMSTAVRTDVRKAEKALSIVDSISSDFFYSVISKTYDRQGMSVPYSQERFTAISEEVLQHGAGKMFAAVDDKERIHAVVFLVWDKNCAYYLIGGGDPELRNSGGATLCLWEAIKFSSTVTKAFDFEGSMVEGIERFFRGFGGKQKPYFRIYRFSNLLIGLIHYTRRRITGRI